MLYNSWFRLASILLFLFAAYASELYSSIIVPQPIGIELGKRPPATISQTNLTISGFCHKKNSVTSGYWCSIDHDGVYGYDKEKQQWKNVSEDYYGVCPRPVKGIAGSEGFGPVKGIAVPEGFGPGKGFVSLDCGQSESLSLNSSSGLSLIVGLNLFFALFLFVVFGVYSSVKNHMFINVKSKFFKKNGGLLLKQHIASHGSGGPKIFTTEELESTCRCSYYAMNKVLVKEKVLVEEGQVERFIDEIISLTEINHQNVIKLLGCCLETEAPILVYESASNGTLSDYIHHQRNGKGATPHWDILMEIASESAAGLAYLHSQSIIHGNVKSSNILVTECFAKVAGFGPPRLVPSNESQISALVQRTLGYIDPQYFVTGQLTNKSDVYSFGVVLVEILTGEKPISFDRPENQRIITSQFLWLMEQQNGLYQILAPQVKEESKEQVEAVAELAKRCLRFSRAERPTMDEVARELKRLSDHSDAYLTVHVT